LSAPNIANPLADFSQKRPVETPLKPASRLFTPSHPMKLSKANFSVAPMFVAALLLGFPAAAPAQILQRFHVTAGAASTTPGSPLSFMPNADAFLAESG